METRPPLPPFTQHTAVQKVRLAEDGWNSRDPARVALAYTEDTRWRNRAEFPVGRDAARQLLERKWARELDYRLIKELWAFSGYRSYGNENWEFNDDGLMAVRHASINDRPIQAADRLFFWPLGRRPDEHPGLSDLGL